MSQFGGESHGRRASGFYGTYKIWCCGKKEERRHKDCSPFYKCEDHDFALAMGAGFEYYDKDKVKGKFPSRAVPK